MPPNDPRTRVLIVDDEPSIAEAFRIAIELQPDLVVTAVVSTVADAVRTTREELPDVVLMDVRLPDASGIQGTALVKEARPETEVILATADLADDVVRDAALAGASGFVAKGTPFADMLETIRAAGRGELVVRPTLLSSLLGRIPRSGEPPPGITAGDRALLEALAEGLRTDDIAARLGVAPAEAGARIDGIRRTLHARSRLEVLVEAAKRGLLADQPR